MNSDLKAIELVRNAGKLRQLILLCALIFSVFSTASTGAEGLPSIEVGGHAASPFRLLVKLKDGAMATDGGVAPTSVDGLNVVRKYGEIPGLLAVEVPATRASSGLETLIKEMLSTGKYAYVEPDWVITVSSLPTDTAFLNGSLWGLLNTGQSSGVPGADINAVDAWGVTKGSRSVVVGVIDTGIRYTHLDLVRNMWRNPNEVPGSGVDEDNNGFVDDIHGINAITMTGDPFDDHDHGTHCSGTIGASANDGNPHVGVAWNVQLMALKFLSAEGSGTTSDAITCIDYAIGHGAHILSNSWGGGGYSEALREAIARAEQRNILFVVAAGNNGSNADISPSYPAAYDNANIVSVAALDNQDNLAGFSNYGAKSVDLGAPGVNIFSSVADSDSSYANFNGTSMAAPHVSGVAALVRSRFPGISVSELKERLVSSVVAIPSMAGRSESGGRLNAYQALTGGPDGTLEVSFAPLAAPLRSGESGTFRAKVMDFFSLTGAIVTMRVDGGETIALLDNGQAPDAVADDGYYTATADLPVAESVDILVEASAPGKTSVSMEVSYPLVTRPANDDFANAIEIPAGETQVSGSNRYATGEPGEPDHAGWSLPLTSVWWKWTPAEATWAVIDTHGSNFDTTLGVYTGLAVDALSVIASNDEFGGMTSQVEFAATAGTTYWIAVDSWLSFEGDIVLNLQGEPLEPQIQVLPRSLTFNGEIGGTIDATMVISNSGTANVVGTIGADATWITVTPASFNIARNGNAIVELAIGPLPEFSGTLSASLTISSNDLETPEVVVPIEITNSPVASIPDENLLAAVREALGISEGQNVTIGELQTLTQLSATQRGIASLAGLESAVALEEIDISGNAITDISPLRDLPNLRILKASQNQITDLTAMGTLVTLTHLSLNSNGISSVSALSGLNQLLYLSLTNNQIADLSGLSTLTALRELRLGSNQIVNTDSLASLSNLQYLSLLRNEITDPSALGTLTGLKELDLSHNRIDTVFGLSDLSEATGLRMLWLQNNALTDIQPLAQLTQLRNVAFPTLVYYVADPSNVPGLRLDFNNLNIGSGTTNRQVIDQLNAISGLDVLFDPQLLT